MNDLPETPSPPPPENRPTGAQRLQQVLAAAGLGSRRKCEDLIVTGRVEVDGRVVTALGTRVDPQRQKIRVDGQAIRLPRKAYYLVNKPPGVLSTAHDPAGRPLVLDLLPQQVGRVFHVGRLDRASEGLMLLTNDGPLANRLTHPRYGVPKTYLVQVAGAMDEAALRKIRHGVRLAEAFVRPQQVRVKSHQKQSTILEIVLAEGRNREIRRLLARTGHKVLRLRRIAVDGVKLGNLPLGAWRRLTGEEVQRLRTAAAGGKRPQTSSPAADRPAARAAHKNNRNKKKSRAPRRPHRRA